MQILLFLCHRAQRPGRKKKKVIFSQAEMQLWQQPGLGQRGERVTKQAGPERSPRQQQNGSGAAQNPNNDSDSQGPAWPAQLGRRTQRSQATPAHPQPLRGHAPPSLLPPPVYLPEPAAPRCPGRAHGPARPDHRRARRAERAPRPGPAPQRRLRHPSPPRRHRAASPTPRARRPYREKAAAASGSALTGSGARGPTAAAALYSGQGKDPPPVASQPPGCPRRTPEPNPPSPLAERRRARLTVKNRPRAALRRVGRGEADAARRRGEPAAVAFFRQRRGRRMGGGGPSARP